MAVNITPIYSKVGDIQWNTAVVKTANTAKDGTGTVALVFTADSTNGGRVEKVRFRAAGTNIKTVARLFINNGSDPTTAANNILYEEILLPAQTLAEDTAFVNYEIVLGIALPPSYRLYVTVGTTVASGFYVSAVGGKY